MLNLALITDIHHGPDRGTKQGSQAETLFQNFKSWVGATSPDMVIDLGDRVSDVDHATDLLLAQEVGTWFKTIEIPRAHLLGNHDRKELSVKENEYALSCSLQSHSKDLNGFHLVFWNANTKLSEEDGFCLRGSDLAWLQEDLATTKLPSIVFSHIPLDNGSMKGNFYFDKAYPHHAYYPEEQAAQAREILEKSKKVILCLNGHTHWNAYHCIDGIHYVTIPSLTELFPTYPRTCESWSQLVVDQDIQIKVLGNLPAEYRLPIRALDSEHWLNVDKDYAPKVATPQ